MAEPITISGQTFVKTDKGWVDKKTKVVAPEGLITLLERMSTGEPVKKLRVKIDRSRGPVTISGQKYVFDSNQNAWITDDAMRWRPPDSMQRVIEEALKQTLGENADQIVSKLGTIGQAAKSAVKKPRATTKAAVDIKINSPIVGMIETLATIDGYLKQRLDNQKKIAAKNLADAKEVAIEASPKDASPVQSVKKEDAEKNNSGQLAAALIVGGLIASQFEPVQDAFKMLADGIKGVWNFVSNTAKIIADGLDMFTGQTSSSSSNQGSTLSIPSENQSNLQPSAANVVEAPSEAAPSEPNKANASPVTQNTTEPNQAVPAQPSSESNRLGRTIVGAAVGGAVAGPIGAAVGGAIGFISSERTGGSSASPVTPSSTSSSSVSMPSSTVSSGSARSDATSQKQDDKKTATAIPQTDIVALGRYLQSQGLRVSGHSQFGGQERGSHSSNSRHYRDMAIDVNVGTGVTEADDPVAGQRFDKLATDLRAAGYSVIWRDKGHYNHLHASVGGPEGAGSSGEGQGLIGMAQSAASTMWDFGASTIESIGGIISASLGPMSRRDITESLIQPQSRIAQDITAASVNRNAAIAESKTPAPDLTTVIKDPVNLNKNSASDFVQNPPSASDMSSVNYYLIRMGVLKRHSQDAMAGMRA